MIKTYAQRGVGTAEIQVVIGDIANQPDMAAVVNAANSKLRTGSGVSRAIFYAAGVEELTKACEKIAPINACEAIITPGFNLPNRFIIHCCGPQFKKDSGNEEKLSSSYWNTLNLAEKSQITSLAIPAISTGSQGFPIKEATRICINAIKEFGPNFDSLKIIRLVVSDEDVAKIYTSYLLEAVPIPEEAFRVDFDAHFSLEQFHRIRKGFVGNHDYKWFMYFEEPWFYIYRGTRQHGDCWWFLKFEQTDDGWRVIEVWADSRLLQWSELGQTLRWLIDDYLPSKNSWISLTNEGLCSYQNLRKGYVKLEIHTNTMSVADVKNLGARLMELAGQLNA